eukprot:gnl/Carplike_NY0171/14352_a21178_129.p1 GENE.gnl/Carplike_NY0171/14352_a21178_129~~gnl/Carplike_NY0171/14352_a21178_129.p1  ORF type:complete len:147 (-),score=24.04 gnl/Carplike_NY0171/14352_a21178_129:281-721(-)
MHLIWKKYASNLFKQFKGAKSHSDSNLHTCETIMADGISVSDIGGNPSLLATKIPNILMMNLHGAFIEVVSSHRGESGRSGIVVYETGKMICIVCPDESKIMLEKQSIKFQIAVCGNCYEISGFAIIGKPEMRLKKKFKAKTFLTK